MSKVRKKYSKSLKFQAAGAMIKGEKTVAEICIRLQGSFRCPASLEERVSEQRARYF